MRGISEGIPEIVIIELDEYWYGILEEQDRLEANNQRNESRKHISYEKLDRLDEFLIPKELYDMQNPVSILAENERREAVYKLYDKILRGSGRLTERQFQAFQYRVLCRMPFEQVAYAMRFDFPPNESVQLAKKHYYNAIKKLRKLYIKDYKTLRKKYFRKT